MNKNAIKKFAIEAREDLISRMMQKAAKYGITEENIGDPRAESISGRLLTPTEKSQRQKLIEKIKQDGYKQVMEAAAYTWFNRFIALRFMEVNKYLPSRVRVFTDAEGNFAPQILDEALTVEIDGVNRDYVIKLLSDENKDELYKYLIIKQCNALGSILPGMFQKIDDWTELLFPDNIRRTGSILHKMVTTIPQEDWDVTTLDENGEPQGQVQIIGWLYQYYNSVPKDKVFENLKKNIKISKNDIPAATQLFTPDWIVRYMVENSLGRIVINNLKYGDWNDEEKAKIDGFKAKWKYYLEEAKQEPEVEEQLRQIELNRYSVDGEEQIFIDTKFIDPCMGSGHILVYAFEVFMDIYKAMGWSERDAALRIVDKNLWGLDIDDRAAQLAYFAVMMKARQYDRNFFKRGAQPHILTISESGHYDADGKRRYAFDTGALDEFVGNNAELKTAMNTIIEELFDAKEYGSILNVTPQDFEAIYNRFDEVHDKISIYTPMIWEELLPIVRTAEALAQKYDVVSTNPPYMGLRNMSKKLFDYVMNKHKDVKQDIFGVFMKVCIDNLCSQNGKTAMITQHVWMFTSGFESYRKYFYSNKTLISMAHLGTKAFEEISGEVVQTCAFIVDGKISVEYKGTFIRLVNFNTAHEKEKQFYNRNNYFLSASSNYLCIPGNPMCYWLSERIIKIFNCCSLVGDVSSTRQGLKTSDDKRFIRLFFEVSNEKIARDIHSLEQAATSGKKWFWLNKGGQVKWYGNNVYLINWENDGKEVKDYATEVAGSYSKNITAIDAYFKNCISWPQISLSHPSFRYMPNGYIFASAGPSLFVNDEKQKWYMLGLLNSNITQNILDAINPTINFGVSDILKIPFIYNQEYEEEIESLVKRAIALARESWDSYEVSWDYKKHPFIGHATLIEEAYNEWVTLCSSRFNELKAIEQRLNELFCQIYSLENDINTSVDEESLNVSNANLETDIKHLISYSVGCMFGRYSLDSEGVIFAGGEWKTEKYKRFMPDKDGIIPICDDEYFQDDIVGRFIEFIKTAFGEKDLERNLSFIAQSLGGKGSSRDVIRKYFRDDFFNDHCSFYSVNGSGKRPIYWLFDSGKKGGFKALIYMHRYQQDLLARMRTDYIHEQQARYRTAIDDINHRIDGASTSERVKLSKTLQGLKEQAEEIRVYEEKIHHLADQMIRIDLDDGVKHNYEIFKDVLAKI